MRDDTIGNIQGLNNGASSPVTIWEPNYDDHTSYGVANARDTYGIGTLHAGTGNDLVPYDGIKDEFDTADNITLGNANATVKRKLPKGYTTNSDRSWFRRI